MDYSDFLASKKYHHKSTGKDIPQENIHPLLFPFQKDLTHWALKKGRAAVFADTGLGKCVAGDTLIPCEYGLIPIESLKPTEAGMGETPLSISVSTHQGVEKTSCFYDSGVTPVLHLKTRHGYELTATPAHPLLVLTEEAKKAWIPLQNIELGSFVAIQRHGLIFGHDDELPEFTYMPPGRYSPSERERALDIVAAHDGHIILKDIRKALNKPVSFATVGLWRSRKNSCDKMKTPLFPRELTPETAYILGVLTGDGGLTNPPTVTLTNQDNEVINCFSHWLSGLGLGFSTRPDGMNFIVYSIALYRWLEMLDMSMTLAHEKHVPTTIMRASQDNVRAYLQGLFDTDGCANKTGYIDYCSASKRLAHEVHLLLLQFGIVSRLRFKPNAKHGAWIIDIFGAEAQKFYDRIGFHIQRKQGQRSSLPKTFNTNIDVIPHLPHVQWKDGRRQFQVYQCRLRRPGYMKLHDMAKVYPELEYLLQPEFFWDEVVSIEDAGVVHTYDVSVPDSHAFVANGFVSHNTFVSLVWAHLLDVPTLIIAPLSVSRQTIREARKIDLDVTYAQSQSDVTPDSKLWITNYERILDFNMDAFDAVVLDESSIIKAMDGKTRKRLTEMCKNVPYRLCCTATPAPNDYIELGSHAEFLGVCTQAEMLAMFFINANKQHTFVWNGQVHQKKGTNKGGTEWRLKHHAEKPFFHWLSSWAISMTMPSDLGYDDDGFILPPLHINPIIIPTTYQPQDMLLFTHMRGLTDRLMIRRELLERRLEALQSLIKDDGSQWIVWTALASESMAVSHALPDSTEVKGSDHPDFKAKAFEDFQDGKIRILVTKAKLGGHGMNFQNSHNMAFFGINDSWESWYQGIRRQYRFGQTEPVNVYPIFADVEAEVYENIKRKDALAARLRHEMILQIKGFEMAELTDRQYEPDSYETNEASGQTWRLLRGDSCERLKELAENSIDLSVYSPPFFDLYTYSNSPRDLGNSKNWPEFFEHYGFIIRETLRVTKPGRLTCVHTSDIPAMAQKDGYIGIKDFPGAVIHAYEANGWRFIGRVFVDKNPQPLKDGTLIFTYFDGWQPIETIRVGDFVTGQKELPTRVIDIPYRGIQPVYRLTFDDGATICCGKTHQWAVRTSAINQWQIKTTIELATTGLRTPSGHLRYEIPLFSSLFQRFHRSIHHQEHRYITAIEHIGSGPCTCLSVDAPDGLFVADHYIVTHNSQAIRIHASSLLFVQMQDDSTMSRPALIDQVLLFKKPGENVVPVTPVKNRELTNDLWIEWAHGVWTDIRETDTLQVGAARDRDDDKHICPLQLPTIERCIKLWSNPGETILDPFAGIGSTCFVALKLGRRCVGIELKESYWQLAKKNLEGLDIAKQNMLFDVETLTASQ